MAVVKHDFMYGPTLRSFARILNVSREFALGKLMFFWEDTQRMGVLDASKDELRNYVDGRDPDRVIDAMFRCGIVIKNDDNTYHICGNFHHISKLAVLKSNSASGGKSRSLQAKREQNGVFSPAESQPRASGKNESHPGVSSPLTLTLKDQDLIALNTNSDLTHTIPINERQPEHQERALKLEEFYLASMRERGGAALTRLRLDDRDRLAELCRLTAEPLEALKRFLQDHREFYVNCKWKLEFLLRDINDHVGVKSTFVAKRKDDDESTRRREAFKSMSADNKRKMDENSSLKSDPEAAAEMVRSIMMKL